MEFVCPDPTATVRAANVRATLDAFTLVPELGLRIVEKHQLHLEDLRPDNFILVQRWLDALEEIQKKVGPSKIRDVGRNIIGAADFPPVFTTAESILLALDQIYYVNHRGDVGHYIVTKKPNGDIHVRCETPYPRMFERGLIEGICRHPKLGGNFEIDFKEAPPGGQVTCEMNVHRL